MPQLCLQSRADSHARIQFLRQRLSIELERCSQRDLRMLERYYVNAEDEAGIANSSGVDRLTFAALRRRLREAVRSDRG